MDARFNDTPRYNLTRPFRREGLLILDANRVIVGNFRMWLRPVSAFEDWRRNPAPDADELEALVEQIVQFCNEHA
jgi:hypothetical protein